MSWQLQKAGARYERSVSKAALQGAGPGRGPISHTGTRYNVLVSSERKVRPASVLLATNR